MARGRISSAIGVILKSYGYTITYLKINPYLNYNAGKMQPSVHGEIFVLKDGGEVDLDLGNYERYCNLVLEKPNFLTFGKILYDLISKDKLGIHNNGEVITFSGSVDQYMSDHIEMLSQKNVCILENGQEVYKKPDIMLIEIGGEPMDEEYNICIKSLANFYQGLSEDDRCFIMMKHLINEDVGTDLAPETSKSILEKYNLIPDLTIFRENELISNCVTKNEEVESGHNKNNSILYKSSNSAYKIPDLLFKTGIYNKISQKLGLNKNISVFNVEEKFKLLTSEYSIKKKIGIITRYRKEDDPYISLVDSLINAGKHLKCEIEIVLIDYIKLYEKDNEMLSILKTMDGILIPGGFGDSYINTKIEVANYARLHNIPCLGICLGFQIQLIEFARNVLKIPNATSKEFSDEGTFIITKISDLDKKVKDGYMCCGDYIVNVNGSMESKVYKCSKPYGRFRHSYCFNKQYECQMQENGLTFMGTSSEYKSVIFMVENLKFYAGVQYHPELSSRPEKIEPVILAFVESVRTLD